MDIMISIVATSNDKTPLNDKISDNYKTLKIPYPRFKILPFRTIGPISTKLGGLTSKDHLIIKKEMGFPSPIQLYDVNKALSKFVYWFVLLFQVSDMAYVRLCSNCTRVLQQIRRLLP